MSSGGLCDTEDWRHNDKDSAFYWIINQIHEHKKRNSAIPKLVIGKLVKW